MSNVTHPYRFELEQYRRHDIPISFPIDYLWDTDLIISDDEIYGIEFEKNLYRAYVLDPSVRELLIDFYRQQIENPESTPSVVSLIYDSTSISIDARVFSFTEIFDLFVSLEDDYLSQFICNLFYELLPYYVYPTCVPCIGLSREKGSISSDIAIFLINLSVA